MSNSADRIRGIKINGHWRTTIPINKYYEYAEKIGCLDEYEYDMKFCHHCMTGNITKCHTCVHRIERLIDGYCLDKKYKRIKRDGDINILSNSSPE